jgi:hypothetical protein
MRRALVLTNEAAKHPFRQSLRPERQWAPRQAPQQKGAPERTDLAFFGISFLSFFIIIYGMIV